MREPPWLSDALGQVGVREGRDDAQIVAYHAATRLSAKSSKVAWCASFVCWCLQEAGVHNPRTARAADLARYGVETYLESGAIIVLRPPAAGQANPDNANSGHVGFLVGVEGDQLVLVSGNSANRVRVSRYPADRLMAVRWPVLDASSRDAVPR